MITFAPSSDDLALPPLVEERPGAVGRKVASNTACEPGLPFSLIITFVLWVGLISVGVAGFVWTPARPVAKQAVPPPVQAELLEVQLSNESVVLPQFTERSAIEDPPALLDLVAEPPMTALAEVAAPNAVVAFALPVAGPVRIVETAQAAHARMPVQESVPVAAGPVVRSIEFGQGKGRQPAPIYPRQAQRERQEGRPGVRFAVDRSGRIAEVALSSPSLWPLLNDSAVETIRGKWRFAAADAGYYEVFIRFELKK
jgi:protein TonB